MPWANTYDWALMVISQSGIHLTYNFWRKWPFPEQSNLFHSLGSLQGSSELEPFSLEQMGMPFMLLAVGTLGAMVAFAVEAAFIGMSCNRVGK